VFAMTSRSTGSTRTKRAGRAAWRHALDRTHHLASDRLPRSRREVGCPLMPPLSHRPSQVHSCRSGANNTRPCRRRVERATVDFLGKADVLPLVAVVLCVHPGEPKSKGPPSVALLYQSIVCLRSRIAILCRSWPKSAAPISPQSPPAPRRSGPTYSQSWPFGVANSRPHELSTVSGIANLTRMDFREAIIGSR
jgi:hypothetical protein